MPQIRIAQNDDADELLGRDLLAFVVGMVLTSTGLMEALAISISISSR